MRELAFIVSGQPVPKGSLKCVGARGKKAHTLVEDNPATDKWRTAVHDAARRALANAVRQGCPWQPEPAAPIGVELTSTLPRPAFHFGTGRNVGRLKATAPTWPTTLRSGDVDKLARLVLDALQDAHVVHDDAQVVEVLSRKTWPARGFGDALAAPGVLVRVYQLEADGVPW